MSSQLSGTAKIVVVGAFGSGKSSFINTASGSMFEVGAPGDGTLRYWRYICGAHRYTRVRRGCRVEHRHTQ
ncbi:hypothetical protein ABKN59_009817 [Abortiporus biennis]